MISFENKKYIIKKGLINLLKIKDADIRILTLKQCKDAIDKGIHSGGAFSVTIPLVSLFYGGVLNIDIVNPTKHGQDIFILSKGHAVAPMASIYADLGYFDKAVLKNSRSQGSILNGHPGPVLPGVHISTGPLGQGLGVAEGFALIGKRSPTYDVYCVVGDGELQEGPMWEAIMYSSFKKLDNLCVLVDKNAGQLDDTKQLIFPMLNLDKRFESFGWRAFNVDGTQYGPVLEALQKFKFSERDGRPTVIICRTRKGFGGYSDFMVGHKVVIPEELMEQEIALHENARQGYISEFIDYYAKLESWDGDEEIQDKLVSAAQAMNLNIVVEGTIKEVKTHRPTSRQKPAPPLNKQITYNAAHLPKLDKSEEYSASSVISQAMRIFARDPRVVSIDADLASTSGLETGVAYVDMGRALNVGVAEANMMCIGEAYAAMGYNAWVSTFSPFFDWKVLRRIAVGYQERIEAIEMEDGWLTDGHGLDLTFLATAPNLETQTNGATHMGNDDVTVFDGIAHLKIIDTSCPNQLLGIMKWVMQGNRGLVYLRIMRSPSGVVYDHDFVFDFGKGYILKESPEDQAVIITSGRGVHEALKAAKQLQKSDIMVKVVDMPSIDEEMMVKLYDYGKPIIIAEQNNGYIWSEYRKILFKQKASIDTSQMIAINTLDKSGRPQFIHSATYSQLIEQFGLDPVQLARTIREII